MARYIDADIVLHKIQYRERTYGCFTKMYSKVIKDAPIADVRPERHGEWLVSGDCYECSECGGGSVVNTNPYCWKCGAKMDGKDGE